MGETKKDEAVENIHSTFFELSEENRVLFLAGLIEHYDNPAFKNSLDFHSSYGKGIKRHLRINKRRPWAYYRKKITHHLTGGYTCPTSNVGGFITLELAKELKLIPQETDSRAFTNNIINPLTKELADINFRRHDKPAITTQKHGRPPTLYVTDGFEEGPYFARQKRTFNLTTLQDSKRSAKMMSKAIIKRGFAKGVRINIKRQLLIEPSYDDKQANDPKLVSRWLHKDLLPLLIPHGWREVKPQTIEKRRD